MGRLVGKTEVTQATGATITATLPAGIAANDLIIVTLQTGNATGNSAESGTSEYTEFGTQVSNDSQRLALFRKTASGSDVSRSFTVPGGLNATCIVSVWRDVDVSGDPIRAITRTDYATYASWTVNTGTVSANDGDLLLFANVQDGAGLTRYDPARVMFVGRCPTTGGNGSLVMGMRQLSATGTTTAETVYNTSTTEGGTGYVFALKHLAGGARQPMVESGATVLNWFGTFADASSTSQMKWSTAAGNVYAASDIISSGTLAGIGISAVAAGVTTSGNIVLSTFGTSSYISPIDNSTGIWGGAVWRLPAEVDMSGKIYRLHYKVEYSVSRVGVEGVAVLFADNAGNWVAYQLATGAALLIQGERAAEIALGHATVLGSSGTMDWSRVAKRGFLEHRIGSSASPQQISVKDELLLGDCLVTGGGATYPGTWTVVADALIAWDFYKLADKLASSLVSLKLPVKIGDASRPTYFSVSGSMEYPTAISRESGISQQEWNVDPLRVGITLNPAASDTINLTAGALVTTTSQPFSVAATASSLCAHSFAGQAISGCPVTLQPGFDFTGMTLSGGSVAAHGAAAGADTDYTFSVLDVETITLHPTANDQAFDFSGCTFSAAITIVNATSYTGVTFAKPTGSSVTDDSGANPVITITAPVITADISITGMSNTVGANNRLQIINQTAVAALDWQAATVYATGDIVLRTAGIGSEHTAGLYMRCTVGGSSGASEPVWDTTVGNTTADGAGTLVWTTYAILYYDADPAATFLTDTYIDGEEFKAGETVEIRFAEEDPAISFKIYGTSVIAATTGFSALANSTADSVYATYALSGAAYETTYSPNYAASYLVLDTNTNFTGASSFAYYCYLLTTSEGMYRFWNGLTALDAGNVRNNVDVLDMFFDETAGFVRQTDDVRIFKSDGTRPALDPTTGGAGIEINWKVPINVVTTGGSAVLPQDILDIADAVWAKTLP